MSEFKLGKAVIFAAAIVCTVLAVCLLTNPSKSDYTLKIFDKDLTNQNELYGKNSWKTVPYITENTGWEDISYSLPKEGNVQLTINWESIYGILPPGYYLLSKQFTDFRGAGDYDSGIYYAFFTIEGEK